MNTIKGVDGNEDTEDGGRASKGKTTRFEKVECDPISGRGCKRVLTAGNVIWSPRRPIVRLFIPEKPLTRVPVAARTCLSHVSRDFRLLFCQPPAVKSWLSKEECGISQSLIKANALANDWR
jgi:hypothetical protein